MSESIDNKGEIGEWRDRIIMGNIGWIMDCECGFDTLHPLSNNFQPLILITCPHE